REAPADGLAAEIRGDKTEDHARPATADIGVTVDRFFLELLVARYRSPFALHDRPPLVMPPVGFGALAVGNVATIVVGAGLLQAPEPGGAVLRLRRCRRAGEEDQASGGNAGTKSHFGQLADGRLPIRIVQPRRHVFKHFVANRIALAAAI